MAEETNNTSGSQTRTFDKGLNEDVKDFHLPSNEWTQARNAINNSVTGDLGKLGNEPGNLECAAAPYPIIGFIHIIEDKWAVFSTDNTTSEIGLFIENSCSYIKVVRDTCLSFSQDKLVIGTSRPTSTCTYNLYWDDGLNPSRTLEIDVDNPARNNYTDPNSTIPWIQNCGAGPGNPAPAGVACPNCVNTAALDCDKIRLAQFINPICPRVENGFAGGNLLNGSYMVAMAYAVNGQKISDWYVSNVQPIFSHQNSSGSIDVYIDSIDLDYSEIQVAVISVVNQQMVARDAGLYSTRQTRLSFDTVFNTWPAIPIEQLPIMTPIVDKSDAMYNLTEYLVRIGPTSKFNFNYQPLANQIVTKWQSVEYPGDYYFKVNNNVGYMRDEVYAFFIQWIYDTGDKSAAYHIPGRPSFTSDKVAPPTANVIPGSGETEAWQVLNTALQTATPNTALPAGGVVISEGIMGYWESSENYPDDKPDVWNANITVSPYNAYNPSATGAEHNLCGLPIRHHKFPEDNLTAQTNRYNAGSGQSIRVMGLKFENIKAPVDNSGNVIPGIVGYRILRGSRNGNRSIIAKGMINNMHEYEIPGLNGTLGLYPNYPYNDLNDDVFLSTTPTKTISAFNPTTSNGGSIDPGSYTPVQGGTGNNAFGTQKFSPHFSTFHSPETNINNPFLSSKELRIYQNIHGKVKGKFEVSEEHPKEKLITDMTFIIASIAGLGIAKLATNGAKRVHRVYPKYPGYSYQDYYSKTNTYKLNENGTDTIQAGGQVTTVFVPTGPFASATGTLQTQGPLPTITQTINAVTGSTTASPPTKIPTVSQPAPVHVAGMTTALGTVATSFAGYNTSNNTGVNLTATIAAGTTDDTFQQGSVSTANTAATSSLNGMSSSETTFEQEDGPYQGIPQAFKVLSNFPLFLNYYSDGSDSIIKLVRAIIRYRDFAVKYISHGFYNNTAPRPSVFRTAMSDQQYIDPEIVDFNSATRINNLYRQKTVVLNTIKAWGTDIDAPTIEDKTRYDSSGLVSSFFPNNALNFPIKTTETLCAKEIDDMSTTDGVAGQVCSSYYGALKVRINNQYGQLNRIVQLPISSCYTPVVINKTTKTITSGASTDPLFGGDTYVNRYTEKNTFFFFNNWLYGQPDGTQLDYNQYRMVAYPKYWANFNQFQTSDFTSSFFSAITSLFLSFSWPSSGIDTPSSFYALDGGGGSGDWADLSFIAQAFRFDKRGWFYLFNSGVRDFFVESEYNLAFRDFNEPLAERFYNPYKGASLQNLFRTDIIKSGNFYKYDISLSVSKLPINYTSWANTQATTYNPYIAETCFVYQPTRLIYSLPAQYEGLKDGWKVFLPNNYYDFENVVTCIKPVNKSGAMIFFDAASPVQFQGTDQLQTDLGTKLTIGDGGLFSQPMQQLVNVDRSHEYASCQNRLSVINTPAGIFWISQNQGKIFNLTSGIKEVSNINMKWWLAQYLPYQLTEIFPDFELIDNPVIGIGCQSVYDNENGLVYFSKKDYTLKTDIDEKLEYTGSNKFNVLMNDEVVGTTILGDSLYFDDCSWTLSFDPKTQNWLSYHDWHPTLTLPGKNTFMTVSPKDLKSIWIHNERCDLYCNYYGDNYPFEVEFTVNTGQVVNSLRSVEYIMEAYKYAANCYDRFHKLNFNFDEATIYNTEQVSGLLKLVLSPNGNPTGILQYPIINPTNINILFSKKENKYRFNQFWDITADRGEFNLAAQRPIWNTAPNGYVRVLNTNNLNYNKAPFERKKFRHYTASVLLRRLVSGDTKMLVMLADVKNLYSPR